MVLVKCLKVNLVSILGREIEGRYVWGKVRSSFHDDDVLFLIYQRWGHHLPEYLEGRNSIALNITITYYAEFKLTIQTMEVK